MKFFDLLSETGKALVNDSITTVEFDIGHSLCTQDLIPSQIFIIENGKARLLSRNKGELRTIATFGQGYLVGIASLLRVSGCEEVTAATQIRAQAIPDNVFVELYEKEEAFRQWCNSTLFPAEIIALLEKLIEKLDFPVQNEQALIAKAISSAEIVIADQIPGQIDLQKKDIYIASDNSTAELGQKIDDLNRLPNVDGPFPLRLISLPTELLKLNTKLVSNSDKSNS